MEELQARLDRASELFSEGKYDEAAAEFEALKDEEGVVKHVVLTNLGAALERSGKAEEALASYDSALEVSPEYVEAHLNRAVALVHVSRHEDALEGFNRCLELRPSFLPAMLGRCEVLCALGRFDEAVEGAQSAVEVAPEEPSPHTTLGFCCVKAGRPADAIAAYEKGNELNPLGPGAVANLAVAHAQYAMALDKEGESVRAEEEYVASNKLRASAPVLFNLAMLRSRSGERVEEAISTLREALTLDPEYANAWSALGTLLLQSEQLEEAARVLEKTTELNPSDAVSMFNCGFAYLKMGRVLAAKSRFQAALEIDPEMTSATNAVAECERLLSGSDAPEAEGGVEDQRVSAAEAPEKAPLRRVPSEHPAPPTHLSSASTEASSSGGGAGGGGGGGRRAPPPRGHRGSVPPPKKKEESSSGSSSGASGGMVVTEERTETGKVLKRIGSAPKVTAAASGGGAGGSEGGSGAKSETPGDEDGFNGVIVAYSDIKDVLASALPKELRAEVREAYLSRAEFAEVFGMDKPSFYKLAGWKRTQLRKKAGLF